MRKHSAFVVLALSSVSVALVILACIRFVDGNLASRIWRFTSSHPSLHDHIREITSPLPVLVVIATVTLWIAYCVMAGTKRDDRHLQFMKLAGTAIPLAFMIKAILQYAFGRTNTRAWLEYGGQIRFSWFNPVGGSSFPSGHTILFTAFLTALWRYYPRFRPLAAALFLGLAAALLLSSYHFVSDIIAGGYCGVLITIGAAHFLSMNPAGDQ